MLNPYDAAIVVEVVYDIEDRYTKGNIFSSRKISYIGQKIHLDHKPLDQAKVNNSIPHTKKMTHLL